MIEKLQAVKGMNDVLPPESAKWLYVEKRARSIFERHGYREIRTPTLEYTPLFVRSIGDTTDIVEKEMYTFDDRDGRSVTLRPEGTASAVRAYIEHSIHVKEPVTRWYYVMPMFRHERAQKGRYRQFWQLGVEAFGVAEPTIDAEQVAMLHEYLTDLGIRGLEVLVNSVGDEDDRARYRAALVDFLAPHRAGLCDDCQRRVDRNPFRVLDCKVETCQALVKDAPLLVDHLSEASRAHFAGVKAALEAMGVPYTSDPRLVRGLDYYTGTTYEIKVSSGDLGSQNTVVGGGRYNNMVRDLGGPPTPAIGFGMGIERVVLSLPGGAETYEKAPEVFFACHGDKARLHGLKLAEQLRGRGYRVEFEHRTASMKAQLKRAGKMAARTVVIIGDTELDARQVVLRDMNAGEQRNVPEEDLAGELKRILR